MTRIQVYLCMHQVVMRGTGQWQSHFWGKVTVHSWCMTWLTLKVIHFNQAIPIIGFKNTQYWINLIKDNCKEHTIIFLSMLNSHHIWHIVGNKLDLELERQVPSKVGQKYAQAQNVLFMEVSWETGTNIAETFEIIVKELEYLKLDEFTHVGQGLAKESPDKPEDDSWWY